MRFSSFIFRAVSVIAVASVVGAEDTSDVLNLTAGSFESSVNPEPLILVEFFAPWCGHCKALAPHYEEAATALKEKAIKLAKVDCVEEVDLCQTHGIAGYPTLKVFRNGTPSDYNGPRKADGIVSYMIKQSLPAVSEVSMANLEDFQKADKIVAIAYLASPTDEPAPEFSAAATNHRDDFLFGLSTDKEAIAAAGVEVPSIVVYRSFDDPRTNFPYPVRGATAKEIGDWLAELSIPIIDEVSGENYATYAASGKPLAYLFVDPTDSKREEYINAIKPTATKHKVQLNFVWIDAIKFGDHAKALNLVEAKWPSFVIQDLAEQLKYPLDQDIPFTGDAVSDFVERFTSGELEPQLKSAPIPESQDESVITVVGKQFEEIVFDDSKDVFVEFYATWCGHCKRLKPTWDSLGDHFADVKDRIIIAKMEAQENDIPPSAGIRVSGFPTLKFKPAGSREFLDYDGDRSLESLIAFVEENAKNSLDPEPPVQSTSSQTTFNEPEPEAEHDEL